MLSQEAKIIERVVNDLSDFFTVLSDGYNPSTISIEIVEGGVIDFEIENRLLASKESVHDLNVTLEKNFNWCLEHLKLFNQSQEIFGSGYHVENLLKIFNRVKNETKEFLNKIDGSCYEFKIDTKDASYMRWLYLESKDVSILIKFGCFIH